jgi:hypothetical protein
VRSRILELHIQSMLTNQNSIQEEIKSRLKSGNACYHSVQNLLSSSLLSKNLKIKIYRTIIYKETQTPAGFVAREAYLLTPWSTVLLEKLTSLCS